MTTTQLRASVTILIVVSIISATPGKGASLDAKPCVDMPGATAVAQQRDFGKLY